MAIPGANQGDDETPPGRMYESSIPIILQVYNVMETLLVSVIEMKKEIILALIVCSLAIPGIAVPVLGQATDPGTNASNASQPSIAIGDRLAIRGKGLAVMVDNGIRTRSKASLLLEIKITAVSGSEVKFHVESGSMTIDGKTLQLQGQGSYNSKGHQITIHLDGGDVKIVLQGRVREVKGRLIISLQGKGKVGDDNYGFRFLCLAKRVKAT
jgi:hypothetical protein